MIDSYKNKRDTKTQNVQSQKLDVASTTVLIKVIFEEKNWGCRCQRNENTVVQF